MTRLFRRYGTFLVILAVQMAAVLWSFAEEPIYPRLHEVIRNTLFVDVHAHPLVGYEMYTKKDPYPTLEPPIFRPFWPTKKDRIAVYDDLQPKALVAIYGYSKAAVTLEDLPRLEVLSESYWAQGKKDGWRRLLDVIGIECVLSNSSLPRREPGLDRLFWVPSVDFLFYPFAAEEIRSISPYLKENLRSMSRKMRETACENEVSYRGLRSYLTFIEKVLDNYRTQGAVALKVASAYFRTLWFDDPDDNQVSEFFLDGLNGKLSDWSEYKKIQDYLARQVFIKAGELGLPVHFHTGFGANAGLKNLDSNPLNLESVFSDSRFDKTKFLVLHAGYPYWDKLKPMLEKRNVYVDFSAVNWMVYEHELTRILHEWLLYPGLSEKVMFGSDAGAPVFFWIAAENSRRALYSALIRLVDTGLISEEKAIIIARKIMRDNALHVHSLVKGKPRKTAN